MTDDLLRTLFGSDSSSDGEQEQTKTELTSDKELQVGYAAGEGNLRSDTNLGSSTCRVLHDVEGVPGLLLLKAWLSAAEEADLLQAIAQHGALDAKHNQAMYFGQLPPFAARLLQRFPHHALPSQLRQRQPLFNQLILNRYSSGEGITDHVDLMRFQDGIAVVSLGDPAIMHFTPCDTHTSSQTAAAGCIGCAASSGTVAPSALNSQHATSAGPAAIRTPRERMEGSVSGTTQVLLEGGDLLLLHGPARYDWTHGIRPVTQEVHEPTGKLVVRGTRVSITLRRLCDEIVLTEPAE